MAISDKQVFDNLMEEEHARRHAAFQIHLSVLTNTPGMEAWHGANLGEAATVYDLNNQPLFYDFPVLSLGRERIGLVRTAASRVLGVPVFDIYLGGAHWTPGRATLQVREYVEKKLKGKVIGSKVICYAYPKMGIEVKWKKPRGKVQRRTVFDIYDLKEIHKEAETDVPGAGIFSIYDNLSEKMVPEALRQFDPHEKIIRNIQDETGLDLSKPLHMEELQRVQSAIMVLVELFYSKILSCFNLYSQIDSNNCTEATVQMLLDWWRYDYNQNEIHTVMPANPSLVKDYQNEVTALMNLSLEQLYAYSDFSPDFSKVRREIDASRPFDHSYFGHSTACAGYRGIKLHVPSSGELSLESVYIYDPYPVNQGDIYWSTYGKPWEKWAVGLVSPLQAFVYLTREFPSP